MQVNRALLGTHADREHFELKIGLLRALHMACPEIDILVKDFDTDPEAPEPVAVAVYDSTKTMRNRAVRIVERAVEEGTWRAFACRSGDTAAALLTVDTLESSEARVSREVAERGSDANRVRGHRAAAIHSDGAAAF